MKAAKMCFPSTSLDNNDRSMSVLNNDRIMGVFFDRTAEAKEGFLEAMLNLRQREGSPKKPSCTYTIMKDLPDIY